MPIDAFQSIVDNPDYPSVDFSVKRQLVQKAASDPDVKALPQDQKTSFLTKILFPTQEAAPSLAGNLSPSQTVQSMKEGIGGGVSTLKKASDMPMGTARIGQDVSGAAQILGGIGAPAAAASMEGGRLVQKGLGAIGADKVTFPYVDPVAYVKSKFTGEPAPQSEQVSLSDVGGALASAALPFVAQALGGLGSNYLKSKFGVGNVSQSELDAARQRIAGTQAAVESAKEPVSTAAQDVAQAKQAVTTAKAADEATQQSLATTSGLNKAQQDAADAALAAKQAALTQRQGAQGMEAGLRDVQSNLPIAGTRTEVGTAVQNDIQNKIDELVGKARSMYGPIREQAAQIPTGATKNTLGESALLAESGAVNPTAMHRAAETWRDLSGDTINEITDRMSKDPTLNFSQAAQQVLESKSKQTVTDLIDQKQRASAIMRRAENRGDDNAARLARNERDSVQSQIEAIAPKPMVAKLKAADTFYANEYAPVASYGAFPRTVRDMPLEDMADQITKIGNKKGVIESWDAMSTALTPDTKNRLASYTFENLMKKSSAKGVFSPDAALSTFNRMDPQLRQKVFGELEPQISDALQTFKSAAGNKVQAERMANALQDASKIAEMRFNKMVAQAPTQTPQAEQALASATGNLTNAKSGFTTAQGAAKTAQKDYDALVARSSGPQKLAEAKISRAMGGRGMMFMKIIGAEEMVRGSLNEWQGNYGIGTAQIARGATLAFPIQVVRLLTSPGGKAVANSLARVAGPTNQAYTSTVKKLADAILQDSIQNGVDRANGQTAKPQ